MNFFHLEIERDDYSCKMPADNYWRPRNSLLQSQLEKTYRILHRERSSDPWREEITQAYPSAAMKMQNILLLISAAIIS